MEEKNEPHFTIAVLLEALKSFQRAHENTANMIVQYSRAIVEAHNRGDKPEAMHQLSWMEMEVRNRERIFLSIRRAESAIRLLNRFTKPYRD